TGLSLEEVESALEARRLANAGFLDDEILPLIGDDSVDPPDFHVLRKEQKEQLAAGIEQLAEQQRIVLTMYYLDDMRLKEIGQVMDLSESRISRVLSQAEFRLREFIRPKE
ncbi:MAG: sigma-70 family RNA polymerase sigma factor, partial [Planctomycetaceae bacterium]